MKKLLIILFALLLLMPCALAAGTMPTTYTSGNWKYILQEDGAAEINRYTSRAKELTVPAELDGYAVTSIGAYAFDRCESLTGLTLPAALTSIGKDAFSNCPSLILIIPRDTWMTQWCKDNAIPYTYPDSLDWLLE